MRPKRSIYLLLMTTLLVLGSKYIYAQDQSWSLRTLKAMSLEEKIGQLFLVAGYVDSEFACKETGSSQIIQELDQYISSCHIGGIAFVGPSESHRQVALTNHYQEISKYPLLIAQDLEWGLAMRLRDGMQFPKNMTLGVIADNQLIYEMGKEVGRQAKLIGVHMNLSPVLDVNTNPDNPVINVRSFGCSPREVATKANAMIQGLQDAGVIASAKHFPGLGDVSIDPHLALPHCPHGKKRLQEVELYPFVQAIQSGVMSIQTEHLVVPALEPDSSIPASLSPKVVAGLLKRDLGFTGLVVSGALRMKALTNHFSDEEIVLKAFQAGSDMLLMPRNFPKAYQTLRSAVAEGKVSEKEIDERVLKILQLKEKVQLHRLRLLSFPACEQLAPTHAKELKKRLYRQAVSLKGNKHNLVPVSKFQTESIAYVQLGEPVSSHLFAALSQSLNIESFCFPLNERNAFEEQRLLRNLDQYSLIVLSVYPADPRRIAEIRLANEQQQKEELKHFRVHGMTEALVDLIEVLKPYQHKSVVVYFGNAFGVHFFDAYSTVIMGHEHDEDAQQAAADILLGTFNNDHVL